MATGKALSLQRQQARRNRNKKLGTPTPKGMVAGISTVSPLNAAQMYGASGLGYEDEATQNRISELTDEASKQGYSRSEVGDFSEGRAPSIPQPLSREGSAQYVKSFRLGGLVRDDAFAGLTPDEANRRALAERQKRVGQVSQNTSYTFNPETLSGTKKLVDRLSLTLNEINNDPFSSVGSKKDKIEASIETSSREFAKLFENQEQFRQALEFDPRLMKTFEAFEKMGGTAADVEARIPPAAPYADVDPNRPVAGSFGAPMGTPAGQPGPNVQDTSTYLANLTNPKANQKAQGMAMDELIPERDLTQQEIARQARIPEQHRALYFGSETEIGTYNMKVEQAKEEIRILAEKEKDEKASLRMKADTAIARQKAEQKIAEAELEQNRLASKNYMTGMLAKLGALNTTGAAVQALASLEAKYNIATSKVKTQYKYDIRVIEDSLFEALNKAETDTADKILKLESDLTKEYETIVEDVLKVERAAEKEQYDLMMRYAEKLRQRTTHHSDELKREAEKYAKEYLKNASTYDFTAAGLPTSKNRITNRIAQELEASRGSDGHVNSEVYKQKYNEWIAAGGTAKTFKEKFPTAEYVNPQDMSLPPNLRYAKESQTIPQDDDDGEFEPLF